MSFNERLCARGENYLWWWGNSQLTIKKLGKNLISAVRFSRSLTSPLMVVGLIGNLGMFMPIVVDAIKCWLWVVARKVKQPSIIRVTRKSVQTLHESERNLLLILAPPPSWRKIGASKLVHNLCTFNKTLCALPYEIEKAVATKMRLRKRRSTKNYIKCRNLYLNSLWNNFNSLSEL